MQYYINKNLAQQIKDSCWKDRILKYELSIINVLLYEKSISTAIDEITSLSKMLFCVEYNKYKTKLIQDNLNKDFVLEVDLNLTEENITEDLNNKIDFFIKNLYLEKFYQDHIDQKNNDGDFIEYVEILFNIIYNYIEDITNEEEELMANKLVNDFCKK
jgi:hypothetical protein